MENARIVQFEDDNEFRELTGRLLQCYGHQVMESVATMEQARQLISELEPGSFDAAIIDGNLTHRITGGDDGREIVDLLHQRDPNIATIAFSGTDKIEGAKYQVGKGNFDKLEQALKDVKPNTAR